MLFPVVYRSKFPRCDKLRSLSVTSLFPSFLFFPFHLIPFLATCPLSCIPWCSGPFSLQLSQPNLRWIVLFSVLPFASEFVISALSVLGIFSLLSAQFHYPAPFPFPFCHFFAKLLSRDSPSFLTRRPTVTLSIFLISLPFCTSDLCTFYS